MNCQWGGVNVTVNHGLPRQPEVNATAVSSGKEGKLYKFVVEV
jgi:hypothetical protein